MWTCTCYLTFEYVDDNIGFTMRLLKGLDKWKYGKHLEKYLTYDKHSIRVRYHFYSKKTFKVLTKIDAWEVFKNKKKNLSKVFTIMKWNSKAKSLMLFINSI